MNRIGAGGGGGGGAVAAGGGGGGGGGITMEEVVSAQCIGVWRVVSLVVGFKSEIRT